jgi:hypothetical protein
MKAIPKKMMNTPSSSPYRGPFVRKQVKLMSAMLFLRFFLLQFPSPSLHGFPLLLEQVCFSLLFFSYSKFIAF